MKKFSAFLISVLLILTMIFSAAADTVASIPGTERTFSSFNGSFFSVSGYAKSGGEMTDRSEDIGTDKYRYCTTPYEFLSALEEAKAGNVTVIEIGAHLNMGWLEIGEECHNFSVIQAYKDSLTTIKPVGNPVLIDAGISQLQISDIDGLTIFSTEGYSVRNAEWKIRSCNDLIIRNIRVEGQREIDDWRDSTGGGIGNTKRVGWSNFKISDTHNLWIDHCTFDYAFDGNIDIENCTYNMSITWCQFGIEDQSNESLLAKMTTYAEYLYQNNYDDSFHIYRAMRDSGASVKEIMDFYMYHKKCHILGGSGDGKELQNASFAYTRYDNFGSRLPSLDTGNAHVYNCVFSNEDFMKNSAIIHSHEGIGDNVAATGEGTYWTFLSRVTQVRGGGAAGCDTNVYEDIDSPLLGTPSEGDKAIIVNSYYHKNNYNSDGSVKSVTEYTGGSFDNNGKNAFTGLFDYAGDLSFSWNGDENLPYSYQLIPLEDTKEVVTKYSGSGVVEMSNSDWCKTEYSSDYAVNMTDTGEVVHPESLKLNMSERKIAVGELLQINAEVYPVNTTDKSLSWTSSNTSVVEVLETGLIVGKGPGIAVIVCKTNDGDLVQTVDITVHKAVEEIKLDKKSYKAYVGTDLKLNATITPEDATNKEVMWLSSDESIAKIDADGTVHPLAEGNVKITCKWVEDENVSTSCTIKVQAALETDTPDLRLLGDVDNNGSVDAADALIILKHAAKLNNIAEADLPYAECNEDENIDAGDALIVLKIAAKLM